MTKSVMIATPVSAGIVKAGYSQSVAATVGDLERNGVRASMHLIDASAIAEQRDVFADTFLKSDFTHLLCVDSDMRFPPGLARVLLGFDLPFVGTIYAARSLDVAKVVSAAKSGKQEAEAFGYRYTCRFRDSKIHITKNGLCEVDGIGFGFVLLTKECLERVRPITERYSSLIAGRAVAGFFQPLTEDGVRLSEDYAFCARWRQVGGKVMAYAHAEIQHIGEYTFGVPFSQAAKAGAL
jgi:hypothetical protein